MLAGLIVYEGIHRLITPPKPGGLAVLIVALVGIAVNLLATQQLARANRESMNIRGSYLHLLTDLFAFIATAIAGAIILATGFDRADGIASLLVAAIMLYAAYGLLKDSGRVLLEAAPEGMSVKEIGDAIAAHPHVESLHDLHVWEVSSGFPALSAHVLVHPGDDCHAIRRELEQMLEERFKIDHTTLQVDHSREGQLITIGTPPPPHQEGGGGGTPGKPAGRARAGGGVFVGWLLVSRGVWGRVGFGAGKQTPVSTIFPSRSVRTWKRSWRRPPPPRRLGSAIGLAAAELVAAGLGVRAEVTPLCVILRT